MIGAVSVFALTVALIVPIGNSGQTLPYGSVSLGASVKKLIASSGSPAVVTTDVGHVWTWETEEARLRVTTDDDGQIHLVDITPALKDHLTFTVPGIAAPRLMFGSFLLSDADEKLKPVLDAAGTTTFPDSGAKAEFRAYKLTAQVELVLLFDDVKKNLTEALYGERDFLARSGLLHASSEAVAPRFMAPTIVHQGAVDYPLTKHQGDTFVRIAVDKTGAVTNATVFISSGDPDLDNAAVREAKQDLFSPARLNNVPVASIVFHKEEFRQLQTQ